MAEVESETTQLAGQAESPVDAQNEQAAAADNVKSEPGTEVATNKPTVSKPPGLTKRSVAIHTGYVGTGYKGVCFCCVEYLSLFLNTSGMQHCSQLAWRSSPAHALFSCAGAQPSNEHILA